VQGNTPTSFQRAGLKGAREGEGLGMGADASGERGHSTLMTTTACGRARHEP
jgi:hypothetical protein